MFTRVVGVLSGIVLCAGCTSAPQQALRKPLPPNWEMTPPESPSPAKPAPTAPPEAAARIPSTPETGWVAVAEWCRTRGLIAPQPLHPGGAESFTLATPNGVWVLTAGSRIARWDGLELHLGFAPWLLEGELMLHALDLRKNLEPLLGGDGDRAGARGLIVLDPGHGGRNTGTRSVADGRWEKEFTLDWAQRLAPLLAARGWRVLLTRTNDADLSLAERVAFAQRHRADLFVSLHFNAAGKGRSDEAGLETYCLTPTGMPSNLTRGFADELVAVFPNNAWDESNLRWAVRLHRALLTVNGGRDRGVRRARFPGVLRGQHCPAVLLEGGYLSNPEEAQKIGDPAYRQQLAEALARALE
ncbi:MAG: N-acetylmuramoyl-L-alanine amidase [Verrucomicrobiae bacterium]|nr:N-acetylmuramoyl-L-alanine amidase [Verrucomicrobiae bacterium]